MINIQEVPLTPNRELKKGNLFPVMITIYSSKNKDCNIVEKDSIDKSNNKSMFDGHFYIRQNGEIFKGRDIIYLGEFAFSPDKKYDLNTNNIGICLEGNFSDDFLLTRQRSSLVALIQSIMADYEYIKTIKYLREFDNKDNPGLLFPFTRILSDVFNSMEKSSLQLGNTLVTTFGARELAFDSINPSKGTDIYLLQKLLSKLEIFNGKINGIYDYATVQSVKEYQELRSLNITGICDFVTIDKMKIDITQIYSNSLFKRVLEFDINDLNINGIDITELQKALNRKSYYCEINGIYDQRMKDIISKYQFENGITEDGKVGPITWNSIFSLNRNDFRELYVKNPPFTGSDVVLIQNRLNEIGYRCPVNGIYDTITETQIRLFQLKMNESPDGKITIELFNKLFYNI